MIDALDETTFDIIASALKDDPNQEVTSVDTKECTKVGSVLTYVQKVVIKVLCGSDSCEAKAEELEDNPPAAVIADVINEAIEDGTFGATLKTNAADTCGDECGELEGATSKPVTVVVGPLVFNTLSPSVSPTSSSPTISPTSSSPMTASPTMKSPTSSSPTTKSVSCCQFKVLSSYITFVHNISHILIISIFVAQPVMIDSPTDNSAAPTSSTSTKNKGNKSGKKGGTKAAKSAKSSLDSKTGSSKADDKSKESSKSSKSTKIEEKDEPEEYININVNEENERGETIQVEDIEVEDTKENNSILDSIIDSILGFLN